MSRAIKPARVAFWFGCVLLLGACDAILQHDLSERQADEVVVALHQAGIGAVKRPTQNAGRAPTYHVVVGAREVGESLSVLHNAGLPHQTDLGLHEVFGKTGIVPTATEEHARFLAALSGELSKTLKRIDGVLDARVHLTIPDRRRRVLDDTPASPKASVLVLHRLPPPDIDTIQRIVAGAVQDLTPARVEVVRVHAKERPVATTSLVRVGPVSVAGGSVQTLKALILGLAAGFMAVGGVVGWALRRASGRP